MYRRKYLFGCDNLQCRNIDRWKYFDSVEQAKSAGWVISRDRKRTYCPRCGPKFKYIGRSGKMIDARDGKFFDFNYK